MRSRLTVVAQLFACLVVTLPAAQRKPTTAPRPYLVIIFTDDQGYADLGCYGNTNNN